jgi:hypothetical protein
MDGAGWRAHLLLPGQLLDKFAGFALRHCLFGVETR